MKKRSLLSAVSLIMAGLAVGSMSACASESLLKEETSDSGIESIKFPFYDNETEAVGDMTLYFLDGMYDIPYIEAGEIPELMAYSASQEDDYFQMEIEDGVAQYTAWNGYTCLVDFNKNEIQFDDYNAFFQKPEEATILDLTFREKDEEGNYRYVAPTGQNFERYGHEIDLLLDDYTIELVHTDELDLMPLQTMNDVFLTTYQAAFLYNGEGVFCVWGGNMYDTPMADIYYSVSPGERSQALADFNYVELCLALDMFYGLKEIHNIDYFDKLFKETGLFDSLISTDPVVYTDGLRELTSAYFGDLHSSLSAPSFYMGEELEAYEGITSTTLIQDGIMSDYLTNARDSYFPDGVPCYQEIGNTAYITFDDFSYDSSIDYYTDGLPEDSSLWDTRGILIYAHSQIKREDSPIENIVIDLSINGGGTLQSAIYVIAWFLGDTNINLQDTFTGAQVSTNYQADLNLDGNYDGDDNVFEYNLYCLTTPYSFSCGNLVPCSYKSSGYVTLLGSCSGGGACVVLPISSADGSLFNISSNHQISIVKNGSFYDVDKGAEVDYHIDKINNYYDREKLTEFINQLF